MTEGGGRGAMHCEEKEALGEERGNVLYDRKSLLTLSIREKKVLGLS
jgi:hypothetical protein